MDMMMSIGRTVMMDGNIPIGGGGVEWFERF